MQTMNRPPYFGMPTPNPGLGFQPIGKMTNSQDPKAKAARVFVGNLNTGVVKEPELISIFQKYGPISAVSLMRGYGFVQFTNEYHARKAVQGEHGLVLADQPIDLRIANDPNPTRPKGFKRVNQQFGYQPYVDPTVLPVHPSASTYNSSQNKKMRFQANTQVGQMMISGDEPSSWVCAFCKMLSSSAWELMKHASMVHQTQIYVANPDYEPKVLEQ